MKNLMCLFVIGLLMLTTACNTDFDLNLINVSVLNNKDTVSPGEELKLKVAVTNSDGIESILIEIPAINVEYLVEDYSEKDKWKFEKHFPIGNSVEIGKQEIFITVIDKVGNTHTDEEDFTIKEQ